MIHRHMQGLIPHTLPTGGQHRGTQLEKACITRGVVRKGGSACETWAVASGGGLGPQACLPGPHGWTTLKRGIQVI